MLCLRNREETKRVPDDVELVENQILSLLCLLLHEYGLNVLVDLVRKQQVSILLNLQQQSEKEHVLVRVAVAIEAVIAAIGLLIEIVVGTGEIVVGTGEIVVGTGEIVVGTDEIVVGIGEIVVGTGEIVIVVALLIVGVVHKLGLILLLLLGVVETLCLCFGDEGDDLVAAHV